MTIDNFPANGRKRSWYCEWGTNPSYDWETREGRDTRESRVKRIGRQEKQKNQETRDKRTTRYKRDKIIERRDSVAAAIPHVKVWWSNWWPDPWLTSQPTILPPQYFVRATIDGMHEWWWRRRCARALSSMTAHKMLAHLVTTILL